MLTERVGWGSIFQLMHFLHMQPLASVPVGPRGLRAGGSESRVPRRKLTVEINSDLLRLLKLRALEQGETLSSLVSSLLRSGIDHPS